jgi:L-alanine-DL-glutamate epimerase-like enolase superfamily enzyme
MSRLTLRLPETLHQQLANLADGEGVSLNQYIVYALTRQTTQTYTVSIVPEAEVKQQQQVFQLLKNKLGQTSADEIESILATRELVEPEPELSVDTIAHLQAKIRARI